VHKFDHCYNQLQFLSGLGPRKAQTLIQKLKKKNNAVATREEIFEEHLLT
jgi:hypothetical protein